MAGWRDGGMMDQWMEEWRNEWMGTEEIEGCLAG